MNVALLLGVLFSVGCASVSNKSEIKSAVVRDYKVGNISLREHQIIPVEHLLLHPEQKGLILAHYLGTGKTFTALALSEKIPLKQIVILGPSFLESNWQMHMDQMGVTNRARYQFVPFESASPIFAADLSSTLVIIDEAHRLVEGMRSTDPSIRERYSRLYAHVKTANRLLLLTGTPIFSDLTDLAFLVNLASGKDLLPYNGRAFLDQYTKVMKNRSFWRGHFTESHILIFGLPFILAGLPLAFIPPSIALVSGLYFGGLAVTFTALPVVNALVPLNSFPLRTFAAEKLREITQRYVSFFDYRIEQDPDYPTQKVHDMAVAYNDEQAKYFIDYANLSLSQEQLARIVSESRYRSQEDLSVNGSAIQASIREIPDNGREIGNFYFSTSAEEIVESPKFLQVLKTISDKPRGVVVYSSYYENGIVLFKDFLLRHGLGEKFALLHPDLPVREQSRIIEAYNRGEIPILLLHPIFTEGISLKATSQLHLLEPVSSQALFEQIIGRTARLDSHKELPPNQRHVDIYAWESSFDGISAWSLRNEDWGKRHNELSSISAFGTGLSRIDENFARKQLSPDQYASLRRASLKNAMTVLKDLLKLYSIETLRAAN